MPIAGALLGSNKTLFNSTPGTTATVSITSTAGSTICVFFTNDNTNGATVTCSDSVDGAYTSPTAQTGTNPFVDATLGQKFGQFYKANNTGGARTLTVTWSGAGETFRGVVVVELTGAGTSPYDGSAARNQAAPGNGTDATTSGAMTNAVQPAGIVACSWNGNNQVDPSDVGTGYTQLDRDPVSLGYCVEFKRITTTGSVSATFTSNAGGGVDRFTTTAMIFDEPTGPPPAAVGETSTPVRRPPQPARQHDAFWASSQSMGVPIIPVPKAHHEAQQPARESRVLIHEGIFQPVQPLAAPLSGITFVGKAGGTTTATLPGFVVGDIAVVFAFRDGTTIAPSVPAGWTSITTTSGTTCSAAIGYRILQAGDTTIGTWTAATEVIVQIYRGQIGSYGVSETPALATTNGSSTTVSYPALSLAHADGRSWVLGFSGHRSINTTLENQPTGMVLRHDQLDGTAEAAGFDTNGGVSSWSLQTVSVGGTTSGWIGVTVEIAAAISVPIILEASTATTRQTNPRVAGSQGAEALGTIVNPAIAGFGEAQPYDKTRQTNPRVAASQSAEARPAIPPPIPFGDAPQPQLQRKRNERATAYVSGDVRPAVAISPSPFPVGIHSSGRYFVDAQGNPRFVAGEAAQGANISLSVTNANTYFTDRAGRGFNAVLIELLSFIATGAPANVDGDLPFTTKVGGGAYIGTKGTADFSTPNDTYFAKALARIRLAASYGFLVFFYKLSWGFGGTDWEPDLSNGQSSANFTGFGTYLATGHGTFAGFANEPNIIWVDGSDDGTNRSSFNPTPVEANDLLIISAMQTGGCTQLRTGDWRAPSLATDQSSFESLMQVQGVYSYGDTFPNANPAPSPGAGELHTYLESRLGWNYTPTSSTQGPTRISTPPALPVFLKETAYEHSPFASGTPDALRKAHWWSILSGATAGLLYGDENVWPFSPGTWPGALSDTSALDMTRMFALINSISWWKLVPSELAWSGGTMRRLIPSSNGSQSPEIDTYIAAAQTYDGTLMLCYAPPTIGGSTSTQTFTVDLRSMFTNARARWWDPTNGNYSTNASAAGTFSLSNTASAQSFTTPTGGNSAGTNDFMLVIDSIAQAGVEVPEQVSRSQRVSRAPFRIQNMDPLPAIAAPAIGKGGFEQAITGRRQDRAAVQASGAVDAPTAGLVDWEPIVSTPSARTVRPQQPRVTGEAVPPPPFTPGGFEPLPPGARTRRVDSVVGNANPMPPPPFPPAGFEQPPPTARAAKRPPIPGGEPTPPPPFTPGGFETTSPGGRPTARPSTSAENAAVPGGVTPTLFVGGFDASTPPARAAKSRPPATGEPVPPPPFVPGGFEVAPAGARPLTRPVILSSENLILPPPPFTPSGFETSPAAARRLARMLVLAADAFPFGVEWSGTFETALAQARPLRARGDWAGEAIAAAFATFPWTPEAGAAALARARIARTAPDQDRFPALAVVTLPAWGFEPEPPRTRSPAADRRLVNGEPLRSPVQVLLTTWGYEPPAPDRRGPRQDRRGIAGDPLPAVIAAALIAWGFEPLPPDRSRRAAARPAPTITEAFAAELSAWGFEPSTPSARAAARAAGSSATPAAGAPPVIWLPDQPPPRASRILRPDGRPATDPPPPLSLSAPAGFDPTAPISRAARARIAAGADPLPLRIITGPIQPWGYEPAPPIVRAIPIGWARLTDGGLALVMMMGRIPVARVGAGGTWSKQVGGGSTSGSGSGGPTGAKRS